MTLGSDVVAALRTSLPRVLDASRWWCGRVFARGTNHGHMRVVIGDVTTAVLSHLHQDHIGGLAELDHADIVVSQAEWDTLSSPLPELRGLMRRHIDLPGLRWQRIEPERTGDPDLARSRRVTTCPGTAAWSCCPPPGTPGSMSLLVRRQACRPSSWSAT